MHAPTSIVALLASLIHFQRITFQVSDAWVAYWIEQPRCPYTIWTSYNRFWRNFVQLHEWRCATRAHLQLQSVGYKLCWWQPMAVAVAVVAVCMLLVWPLDQFIKEKTRPNSLAAEPLVAWCQQFLPFYLHAKLPQLGLAVEHNT